MPSPEECVRQRAIAVLGHYRRMEVAASKGFMWQRDVDLAVVSVVTRFTQEIENQLQRLFVQLIIGTRTLPSVRPLVSFRSSAVLHEHLKEGQRPYADWLPYNRTVKRAERYFSGGKPFTNMKSRRFLNELQTIRNALVHNSRHSMKRFEDMLANRSVPRYERTPIRYLRGLGTDTESRLEQHLASATFAFNELVQ